MKYLDQSTLQLTLCCLFFVVAILMLLLQRKSPTIKGPFYWGVGSLLLVLGMVLFLLHPISEYLAFVVAGAVIVLGWNFYLIGIWKFKKVKVNYWIVLAFPILELIQGTIFLKIYPLPHVRMANYSILVFIVSIFIAVEFFKPCKPYLRQVFIAGGIVFIARALSVLPRSIFSLLTHHGDAVEPTSVTLALLFSTIILQLIIFSVFIFMTLLKQEEQTKKQIKIRNSLYNIIAHDLKGPIGNISEFLKILNSTDIPPEQQSDILKKLEKLSVSTFELLQNLLLWSNSYKKSLMPERKIVDVSKSISENVELYLEEALKKGIQIKDCKQEGVYCYSDTRMFNTVLRNVIANAIKFSNTDGEIIIDCTEGARQTKIVVRDNGIGIEQTKIDSFNKGNIIESTRGTYNEAGTGVGLVMCRDFITKNDGEFIIESKPNNGTQIIILLPSGAHLSKKIQSVSGVDS